MNLLDTIGHWTGLNLFTSVFLNNSSTGVTFNMTTPMEFAIASLLHYNLFRIVSTATAKDGTTIQSGRRLITNAIVCSCGKKLVELENSCMFFGNFQCKI